MEPWKSPSVQIPILQLIVRWDMFCRYHYRRTLLLSQLSQGLSLSIMAGMKSKRSDFEFLIFIKFRAETILYISNGQKF